jgi:hypothetical protein
MGFSIDCMGEMVYTLEPGVTHKGVAREKIKRGMRLVAA